MTFFFRKDKIEKESHFCMQYIIANYENYDSVEFYYIDECYRRMYAEAIGSDGVYSNYDKLMYDTIYVKHTKNFPYEAYYIEDNRMRQIIDEVCSLPYKKSKYTKTLYKLPAWKKNRISNSVCLGISPLSTPQGMVMRHPESKKYFTEDELKERRVFK